MAISEDTGNQPVAVHAAGASPSTTASFSPQAGTLLVAMVGTNGPSGTPVTATISDSLAGGWTLLKRQNTSASMGGTAEVWCRYLSSAPGSMTVTASWTGADLGSNLVVRCLLGAASTQNGATAGNGGASIAPNVAITPTQTGSWVYGALVDWTAATTMVANGITTIIDQFNDGTNGDTYAALKATAATSSLSPTTYGCTNVNAAFNVAFAEILAAATVEPGPLGLLFRQGPSPLDGMLPWTGAPDAPHDVTVNAGTASARALVPATRTFLLLSLVSETGPGATVQTFNDAASLPLLFQPDDPTGGMAPWSGAPDGPSINGNTTANAGVASATGAALQPIVGLGSLPGAAAGTGSAPGPATGLGALPGPAAGTGAALTGSVALVTQGTGTATGTGSVGSPVPSLGSVPGTAAGTGAALDLTAGLGVLPSTAPASGTALPSTGTGTDGPIAPLGLLFLPDDLTGGMQPWGGAEVGIVTGDKSVGAGVATAIGAALGPVASLGILPGTGTAAGAGLQPVAGLGVLPGSATAAGAASGPVTAVAAGPGRAQATAAAFTETSALSALPGTAPANAVAYGATATGSGTTTANAGVATATAAGLQPVAGLGVLPGTAAGTGTGRTATAGLTALPGTAPATGMAQNPSAAFSGTATAGVATGTGAARTASTGLGSVPGTANAAATARQPVPGLSLRAVGTATATAAAYDVTGVVPQVPFQVRLSGRESLSAVSGRESPGLVSGREPAGPSAGREPVSSVSGEEPDSSISGEEAGT